MNPKITDITGSRFGRLLVIKLAEPASNGSARWLCKCNCGNLNTVRGINLRNGITKSCGCLSKTNHVRLSLKDKKKRIKDHKKEIKIRSIERQKKNNLNRKFGWLTIIKATKKTTGINRVIFKCQCRCGNIIYRSIQQLIKAKNGNLFNWNSCGCFLAAMRFTKHTNIDPTKLSVELVNVLRLINKMGKRESNHEF